MPIYYAIWPCLGLPTDAQVQTGHQFQLGESLTEQLGDLCTKKGWIVQGRNPSSEVRPLSGMALWDPMDREGTVW